MTRPLQKKKNKSSLHRVRQKPKSKKPNIKGNPIVAANWNSKLTLTQNYRRLGLSSRLNTFTGGVEKTAQTPRENEEGGKDTLAIPYSTTTRIDIKSVQVVRDPVTGAIRSVVRDEKEKRANPLNDPLNDIEDEDEERNEGMVDASRGNGVGIVPELEEAARQEKKKRPRRQSEREKEWVERLVKRWGDDWGGMVRDRKLNPMQQSEGDLRRRVEVWRRQEGIEML